MSSNKVMYFIFSTSQKKFQQEMSKRRGVKYEDKTVISKGLPKIYTDMLEDPNTSKYTDAIIVASGILSQMKYTK